MHRQEGNRYGEGGDAEGGDGKRRRLGEKERVGKKTQRQDVRQMFRTNGN